MKPSAICFALCCLAVQAAVFAPVLSAAGEWPEFRGPDGQGRSTATGLPLTWSETENIVWKADSIHVDHQNGPGSSPVIWQDLLIIHFDGIDAQFLTAFDRTSGKVRWKTARSGEMDPKPELQKAYGTPLIVEAAGRPIVVSPAANWVYGYDARDGTEIWKARLTGDFSASPLYAEGRLYFFGQNGTTAVLQEGPELKELARNRLDDGFMASPAVAGRALFLRTERALYRIEDIP